MFGGKPGGEAYLTDLRVGTNIILKKILRKKEFLWYRIRTSGRLL
jgi:hypothetical protein